MHKSYSLVIAVVFISLVIAPQIASAYSSGAVVLGHESLPRSLIVNSSTAYVADYGGNVTLINLTSGTVQKTLRVGYALEGIAISPDRSSLYVTDYNGSGISSINLQTGTISRIAIPDSAPYGIAITPDGKYAYVTNPYNAVNGTQPNGTVEVVNLNSGTVVSQIKVGRGPQGIAISPSGGFAYVANYDDSSLSIINTTTNRVISTIPVGYGADSVAITPNGQYVYTSNYNLPLELYLGRQFNGSVSVINGYTNSFVKTIVVGEGPDSVAVSPSTPFVYAANAGDGSISIISTVNNTVVGIIKAAPFAKGFLSGIAIAPGGSYAYLTDPYNNSVIGIDLATATVYPPTYAVVPPPIQQSQNTGSSSNASTTTPAQPAPQITTPPTTQAQNTGQSQTSPLIEYLLVFIVVLLIVAIILLLRMGGQRSSSRK